MIQLVTYDLQRPGQNYPDLHPAIQKLGTTWWHCLDSVWLVKTTLTAAQIRDFLTPYIDGNDKLLVVPAGPTWASLGITGDCLRWLQENM